MDSLALYLAFMHAPTNGSRIIRVHLLWCAASFARDIATCGQATRLFERVLSGELKGRPSHTW